MYHNCIQDVIEKTEDSRKSNEYTEGVQKMNADSVYYFILRAVVISDLHEKD